MSVASADRGWSGGGAQGSTGTMPEAKATEQSNEEVSSPKIEDKLGRRPFEPLKNDTQEHTGLAVDPQPEIEIEVAPARLPRESVSKAELHPEFLHRRIEQGRSKIEYYTGQVLAQARTVNQANKSQKAEEIEKLRAIIEEAAFGDFDAEDEAARETYANLPAEKKALDAAIADLARGIDDELGQQEEERLREFEQQIRERYSDIPERFQHMHVLRLQGMFSVSRKETVNQVIREAFPPEAEFYRDKKELRARIDQHWQETWDTESSMLERVPREEQEALFTLGPTIQWLEKNYSAIFEVADLDWEEAWWAVQDLYVFYLTLHTKMPYQRDFIPSLIEQAQGRLK